jgi:Zn-dependent protease
MAAAMKTEVSWTFLGLVALWLLSGLGLVSYPRFAGVETFVFVLLGWIISLCLHEYAHAATASAFGDTSIADSGYLTLNPRHYFTGAHSLVLPVLAVIFGGIALPGGAVMIRNDLIRKPWQQSLVALAGPFATLTCTIIAYAGAQYVGEGLLSDALILLAFFELMAFVLNMLPVPGLDGFAALRPWLPKSIGAMIPPQVGGLVMVAGLIAVFFYGYHIINPVMRAIADATGLNLHPAGRAMDRFHFW